MNLFIPPTSGFVLVHIVGAAHHISKLMHASVKTRKTAISKHFLNRLVRIRVIPCTNAVGTTPSQKFGLLVGRLCAFTVRLGKLRVSDQAGAEPQLRRRCNQNRRK